MKILLSLSKYHFNPYIDKQTVLYGHSMGVIAKLFYDVASSMGEVDYIDSTNSKIKGKKYDLLISLPRNFDWLTKNNQFGKTVCYLNVAESKWIKKTLSEESKRLGCKLRDCYTPYRFYHADMYFMLGGEFLRQQYKAAGIPNEKLIDINYGMDAIPFKARDKQEPPVFIHIATTLGLRKGFWHVINDFRKANLPGATLRCIGSVQNERMWQELAKKANEDPRIKIYGWIPCHNPEYLDLIHTSDFYVFPSWAEGQGGTTMEAISGGCIPIVAKESGFPHFPIGEYIRGDTKSWQRAYDLPNSQFRQIQLAMQELLKVKYNNKLFKQIVEKNLKELLSGKSK